jgi:hypothetical protein
MQATDRESGLVNSPKNVRLREKTWQKHSSISRASMSKKKKVCKMIITYVGYR